MLRILAAVCVMAMWWASPVLGQDSGGAEQGKEKAGKGDSDKPAKFRVAKTMGRVAINGSPVEYEATAGLTELPDYDGKPKANVFSVSYVAKGGAGGAPRPVLFAFNGGPGSSSVWLHMGTIGPKRVDFARADEPARRPTVPQPPYRVIDNEYSWLDLADLVFIDPVSTGYSRPAEGQDAKQFHGLDEDIRWVGDFIRLWVTKNNRWNSPIYLAGESYGTTRAAGLSGYLQDTHGMYLSGLVLISSVLDFQTLRFDVGNDTPFWLYLPTYAATAWYHGKLGAELAGKPVLEVIREAEQWASSEYLLLLAKGDALSDGEKARLVSQLSRFTGLSPKFIELSDYRINIMNFCKELLREEGRTVGRLDSRFSGIDRSGVTASFEFDPSYSAIQGAFTAAVNHYLRAELGYENDDPYEILTGRVNPWSYASSQNRYANVAETLRSAMTKNPSLRVLFASGYYDLATPHFAADYTIARLGLDASLRKNIRHTYYESGHMMYIRHADLVQLKKDVAGFVAAPAGAK